MANYFTKENSPFPMTVEQWQHYEVTEYLPKNAAECYSQINAGHVSLASALLQPIGSNWEQAAIQYLHMLVHQVSDEGITLEQMLNPETEAARQDWLARKFPKEK